MTAAQLIIDMLKDINSNYLSDDHASLRMRKRINFAIDKIGKRSLFDVDLSPSNKIADLSTPIKRHVSNGWLNEYSVIGMELERGRSLEKSLIHQ